LTNLIHELANQKPECAYGARMGNDLAMPLRDDELSAGWGEGGILVAFAEKGTPVKRAVLVMHRRYC